MNSYFTNNMKLIDFINTPATQHIVLKFFEFQPWFILRLVCKSWNIIIIQLEIQEKKQFNITRGLSFIIRYGLHSLFSYLSNNYTINWNKNPNLAKIATMHGHLHCLQFLLEEQHFPYGADLCVLAAAGGHINCLKYLHEMKCTWNYNTLEYAIANGHLNCVAYALSHGCEGVMEYLILDAAANKQIEIFTYLVETGDWSNYLVKEIIRLYGIDSIYYSILYEDNPDLIDNIDLTRPVKQPRIWAIKDSAQKVRKINKQ